jgi:tetratricopeptide (TPR) repeat protein
VSDTAARLLADLDASGRLPFGIARSATVEDLVSQADDLGDTALAVKARLHLMTAYSYGGEPLRRFPVFDWLLARRAEDPDLFDADDRHQLLWMFKWVTVGVVDHPSVPLDRIMHGLDDMERRYTEAGEGLAPVLSCRFQVRARVHGHEAARQAYQDWQIAPRTALSDCATCEPALRVWHLAALDQDVEALSLAFPVLDHGHCADQPQKMIGHVLEPLLRSGMPDRAATEHLRGVRLLREQPGNTTTWAQHIWICARSGRLHRGLDLLEHRLHEVDDAAVPEDAMWLAAAGARLLRGLEDLGEGDLPVHEFAVADDSLITHRVTDLRQRLARKALELADRFDHRNSTTTVGTQVKRWIEAPELPDLPIGRVLTRPRSPAPPNREYQTAWQVGPSSSTPRASGAPSPRTRTGQGEPPPVQERTPGDHTGPITDPGGDPLTLWTSWQEAERTGSRHLGDAVLARWSTVEDHFPITLPSGADEVSGMTEPWQAAAAQLSAARASDQAGRGLLPIDRAREHAVVLNELGLAGPALRHALTCVRILLTEEAHALLARNDQQAALAVVEGAVSDAQALVEEGDRVAAEEDRICLYLGYAAVLRAAATVAAGSAEELRHLATEVAHDGIAAARHLSASSLTPPQRGCLALLQRDVAMTLPGQERVAPLEIALDLLPAGERSRERALVGYALGTVLAEVGESTRAELVLASAADDALISGNEELAVHTLHALGRALAESGDPDGAIEALTRAVRLCGPESGALLLGELRQGLAAALRDTGQVVEAAELADGALDELEDALSSWDIDPPQDRVDRERDRPGAVDAERVAGNLAFTAAQCAQDLSEDDLAADMARRAAAWQHGHGIPEAEALVLAGQTIRHAIEATDLYARAATIFDEAGRWWSASACRRSRSQAVLDHRGLSEALDAVREAADALDTVFGEDDSEAADSERTRLSWERLALREQEVRLRLTAGDVEGALTRSEGLSDRFRQLGDTATARDVVALRAQVLDEVDRLDEGIEDLVRAAEEARDCGHDRQSTRLAEVAAAFLDGQDRVSEAAAVRARFASGPPSG